MKKLPPADVAPERSVNEPSASPAEPDLTFAEYEAILVHGIEQGRGSHRQASFHLDNARRLERQAGQYRLQIAGIRAAQGIRSGVRLSHLTKTLKRLEADRDKALAGAEIALQGFDRLCRP